MMDGGSPRDIGLEPQIVHNRPHGRHVTLAQRRGLTNIRFEVRDAAKLDDERRFDAVFTFDAIHDQLDLHAMLDGVHRALKSGGLLLAQDIRSSSHLERNLDHPVAPFLYTISTLHCIDGIAGALRVWAGHVLGRRIGADRRDSRVLQGSAAEKRPLGAGGR